jgi:prepilin-type N-terminal cleavage/methylation domain-containing protein
MLARIRKSMDEKDSGFTLIELLVVMIIIGILAAIAIPIFLNQRKKAVDSSIKSDMKNVASAIESWAVDNPGIAVPAAASTAAAPNIATFSARTTTGNVIAVTAGTTTGSYCIKGYSAGSNAVGPAVGAVPASYFWYASDAGGLKAGAPDNTSPGGACG